MVWLGLTWLGLGRTTPSAGPVVLVLMLMLVLVFFLARSADLDSLLVYLGSLLGISFGSRGGMLPDATANLTKAFQCSPRPF